MNCKKCGTELTTDMPTCDSGTCCKSCCDCGPEKSCGPDCACKDDSTEEASV